MSGQHLRQEIKTSLKLTASMTQSIKTLQLSSQELDAYISNELQENPFLIKEEPEEEIGKLYDKRISTKNRETSLDYDFISNIESKISLKEHLLMQISTVIADPNEKLIGGYITDLLDENGYLHTQSLEIAEHLKIPEKMVEDIILQLQKLDPSGVYARGLSECLKIQLQEQGAYNQIFSLIMDNLQLVANGENQKLAKICKIEASEMISYIRCLKKLEPKPGRNFSPEIVNFKIPDVKIMVSDKGELVIISNKESMPALYANKEYYKEIKNKITKIEEQNLTSDMMKNATNIAKAVEMRSKTIILVAEALAKEQEEFFRRGVLYLKPLTLAKIAEMTGHNESTISRATSNKYIETPYGVLEMKYFFSSGVRSKYSKEEVSSHKVKELIKTLIDDEDKARPMSDDELAIMLKQFNIIIARRTIAKYREAIKIPTSSKRKIKN